MSANNIELTVNIIIILIFVINILLGYFRGFIKTLFGFLTFGASFVISYIFAKPVSAILKDTGLRDGIFSKLKSGVSSYITDLPAEQMGDAASPVVSDTSFLETFGRSSAEINSEYARIAAEETGPVSDSLAGYIVEPATDAILVAISFVGLFILSYLVLKLVAFILNIAAKIPVISTFNRILGIAAGFCFAFVQTILLTVILNAVIPCFDLSSFGITVEALRASSLYCWFDSLQPASLIFFK